MAAQNTAIEKLRISTVNFTKGTESIELLSQITDLCLLSTLNSAKCSIEKLDLRKKLKKRQSLLSNLKNSCKVSNDMKQGNIVYLMQECIATFDIQDISVPDKR